MALGTRRGKGAAAQPIGAAAGAHPTVSPPPSAFLSSRSSLTWKSGRNRARARGRDGGPHPRPGLASRG